MWCSLQVRWNHDYFQLSYSHVASTTWFASLSNKRLPLCPVEDNSLLSRHCCLIKGMWIARLWQSPPCSQTHAYFHKQWPRLSGYFMTPVQPSGAIEKWVLSTCHERISNTTTPMPKCGGLLSKQCWKLFWMCMCEAEQEDFFAHMLVFVVWQAQWFTYMSLILTLAHKINQVGTNKKSRCYCKLEKIQCKMKGRIQASFFGFLLLEMYISKCFFFFMWAFKTAVVVSKCVISSNMEDESISHFRISSYFHPRDRGGYCHLIQ